VSNYALYDIIKMRAGLCVLMCFISYY